MAETIEDVLARRFRLLFLDARAAMEAAPMVAEMLALLKGNDEQWQKEQLDMFNKLAEGYLVNFSSNGIS